MKDRLFRVNLCYHHEQERNPNQYQEFLCVTTVDKIAEILDLYDKLWNTLHEGNDEAWRSPAAQNLNDPISESTIIEELESLDQDALLEDIETGEKFWYVHKYDKDYKVTGYKLEPIK
jgi:hypothetical protein